MAAGKTGNSDEKFSCCINPILREGQAFLTIVIVIFSIHQQTLDRFGYTGVGLSNKCGNNKQLLDEVFVISRIIKVEIRVTTRSRRLKLITLAETLIMLDVTKTSYNNCFIIR